MEELTVFPRDPSWILGAPIRGGEGNGWAGKRKGREEEEGEKARAGEWKGP